MTPDIIQHALDLTRALVIGTPVALALVTGAIAAAVSLAAALRRD